MYTYVCVHTTHSVNARNLHFVYICVSKTGTWQDYSFIAYGRLTRLGVCS